MRRVLNVSVTTFVTLLSLSQLSVRASAQSNVSAVNLMSAKASPLPNGIEVQTGELHEKIVALRDDVLRISVSRGGSWPEDASWAVLSDVRHRSPPINTTSSGPVRSDERAGARCEQGRPRRLARASG